MEGRREFLRQAAVVSGGAAVLGSHAASAQGLAGSNLVGRLEGATIADAPRPAQLKEAPQLAQLVREGKLVPVAAPAEDKLAPVTYHDPCYLGRHNDVYEEPRALVGAVATLTEMPRHADRSMCCGAGGAQMWMEERIGQRVNVNRTEEAITTLSDAGSNGSGGTMTTDQVIANTFFVSGAPLSTIQVLFDEDFLFKFSQAGLVE